MAEVVENISLVNFTLLTRMFKGFEEGLTVFETTHLTRDLFTNLAAVTYQPMMVLG